MIKISTAPFIDYDASKYNFFTSSGWAHQDSIAEKMSTRVWSPCIWSDRRKKDNFLHADLAAFDFDDGRWSVDDAVDFVANITSLWAIVGTTKSHQIEKNGRICDRFRLVLHWASRINDARQYEQNVRRLTRAFPCDPAVVDAGRLFFPCTKIVHSQPGAFVPVKPYTPPHQTPRPVYQTRADVPPWMDLELRSGITENRNNTAFRYSLHLKDRGLDQDAAFDVLSAISLSETELKNTIRSAYRYSLNGGTR